MADRIQPGAYVRAIGGMYAGATGRVVAVGQSASGPYATVDVGEAQPIAVFVTGLELVGAVPTVEQERDAAIAERDRLRRELEALRAKLKADMPGEWDGAAGDCCSGCYEGWDAAIAGIDAILRGGEP